MLAVPDVVTRAFASKPGPLQEEADALQKETMPFVTGSSFAFTLAERPTGISEASEVEETMSAVWLATALRIRPRPQSAIKETTYFGHLALHLGIRFKQSKRYPASVPTTVLKKIPREMEKAV